LALALTACTATAAVADLVALRSGATLRGAIENRAQLLRSPGLVTVIEFRPEMPGVDAAGVRTLSFARSEVDFVVLEDGRLETTIPLSARAGAAPRAVSPQRVWLAITVSRSAYEMADLNDFFTSVHFRGTPIESFGRIDGGFGAGMELGVDLPSGFTAGLGWDRLGATTDGSDPLGEASLGVSAFLLRAFGSFGIVRTQRGSARLGASLGAVVPSVILDHTNPSLTDHRDRVVGVAPAGEIFGGGELQLYPWLGMSLDTGYRRAVSRDVPIATLDLRDLDYSGWFLRAGLRFSLPN
jgi:hypothetical protein